MKGRTYLNVVVLGLVVRLETSLGCVVEARREGLA